MIEVERIVEPPFQPVSLTEVYARLRIEPCGSPPEHEDDATLERNIASAATEVERATRRSLVQQTLRLTTNCFRGIELRRPPLIVIESVRYYDSDNEVQTVSPASYFVTTGLVPKLQFVSGWAEPTLYDRPDAVQVTYATGYEPGNSPAETQADYAANVPGPLKEAILIGVQLLYEPNLTPQERKSLEMARDSLVDPYTVHSMT